MLGDVVVVVEEGDRGETALAEAPQSGDGLWPASVDNARVILRLRRCSRRFFLSAVSEMTSGQTVSAYQLMREVKGISPLSFTRM